MTLPDNIAKKFTPEWVLKRVSQGFVPEPAPIPKGSDGEWLIANQERIRMLMLAPIKDDDVRADYNSRDKVELERWIRREMRITMSGVAIRPNAFPYALGPDVTQYVVWAEDHVNDYFLKKLTHDFAGWINAGDFVSFERNRMTMGTLAKGTFPAIRHLHLWLINGPKNTL